jgi:hypothetical protein
VIIRMSRPWRHPQTRIWHWRGRLPADVAKKLVGERVTLDVAGETSAVTLGTITKVSLRTKDEKEALLRHAAVQAQLQQHWAAARKGAVSLSHQQLQALAGVWYRDLIATHEGDPGDLDSWDIYWSYWAKGSLTLTLKVTASRASPTIQSKPRASSLASSTLMSSYPPVD